MSSSNPAEASLCSGRNIPAMDEHHSYILGIPPLLYLSGESRLPWRNWIIDDQFFSQGVCVFWIIPLCLLRFSSLTICFCFYRSVWLLFTHLKYSTYHSWQLAYFCGISDFMLYTALSVKDAKLYYYCEDVCAAGIKELRVTNPQPSISPLFDL